MLISSESNNSACQFCGRVPEDGYSRRPALHTGYRYAKTRSNRVKLVWLPEELKPIFGDRLGKLLCPKCYSEVTDAINSNAQDRIEKISRGGTV